MLADNNSQTSLRMMRRLSWAFFFRECMTIHFQTLRCVNDSNPSLNEFDRNTDRGQEEAWPEEHVNKVRYMFVLFGSFPFTLKYQQTTCLCYSIKRNRTNNCTSRLWYILGNETVKLIFMYKDVKWWVCVTQYRLFIQCCKCTTYCDTEQGQIWSLFYPLIVFSNDMVARLQPFTPDVSEFTVIILKKYMKACDIIRLPSTCICIKI